MLESNLRVSTLFDNQQRTLGARAGVGRSDDSEPWKDVSRVNESTWKVKSLKISRSVFVCPVDPFIILNSVTSPNSPRLVSYIRTARCHERPSSFLNLTTNLPIA